MLIEPVLHSLLTCLVNPSPKRNKIICKACVGVDQQDKFFEMIDSHFMSTSIGFDSDIKNQHDYAGCGKISFAQKIRKTHKFGAATKLSNELLKNVRASKVTEFL